MSRSSKRLIASFAALEILLYHCWIPVFGYGSLPGRVERFLIASTFPGVDIFFFISAFSLVSHPVDDYGRFLENRAAKLLPPFMAALLAGRFLWFIPSIMMMYLILPPLHRICRKKPLPSFVLLMAGWAAAVYLILGILRPLQDFGIFLFRIPSMILGAYAVRFREKLTPRKSVLYGSVLLIAGTVLVYRFGYADRLDVPFRGTFYLTGIPVMLGTVMLLDAAGSGKVPPFVERFGAMTLELYFTQMVFGNFFVRAFFSVTGSRILTNAAVLTVTVLISRAIKMFNDRLAVRLQE